LAARIHDAADRMKFHFPPFSSRDLALALLRLDKDQGLDIDRSRKPMTRTILTSTQGYYTAS
jgi:hypothetical protein